MPEPVHGLLCPYTPLCSAPGTLDTYIHFFLNEHYYGVAKKHILYINKHLHERQVMGASVDHGQVYRYCHCIDETCDGFVVLRACL